MNEDENSVGSLDDVDTSNDSVDPWDALEKELTGTAEDESNADDEPEESDQAQDGEDAESKDDAKTDKPKQDEAPKADQPFVLKHLGTEKTVTRDEAVVLAQKGLDYDRIRPLYDEAKAFREKNATAITLLEEIAAADGLTIEQLASNAIDAMDESKARIIAERDGIDYKTALRDVRLDRKERAINAKADAAAKKAKSETDLVAAAEAKRNADIKEFLTAHQELSEKDLSSLPEEVIADISKGKSLLNAYDAYQLRKEKAALEAEKTNLANQKKAAPSLATAGKKTVSNKYSDGFNDDIK